MTKKDFIIVAAALKKARASLMYGTVSAPETRRVLDHVIDVLCVEFSHVNPRFDSGRFSEASGQGL